MGKPVLDGELDQGGERLRHQVGRKLVRVQVVGYLPGDLDKALKLGPDLGP
jgi:hypothetical protein